MLWIFLMASASPPDLRALTIIRFNAQVGFRGIFPESPIGKSGD